MDASQMIPGNGQGLREAPPILPIELSRPAAPTYYPQLQAQDSMLREYLRVLIKRKWVVISSVLIIFGVVATATMRTTRIYEAAGSIAIKIGRASCRESVDLCCRRVSKKKEVECGA